MKVEHFFYLVAVYIGIHYLLAQPKLPSALRSLLEPIEYKALTNIMADVLAV